ncbi:MULTISPECIES: hypothetical protein [unclassified Novosphingobium]|uniref:hypothetical protein n=1 Tax=unclassified Novosphingobium TaxID=2644732 RepID=UPI0025E93ECA|nr:MULTISPECIES: hypothetical protein [unclassified Novosphingobium]
MAGPSTVPPVTGIKRRRPLSTSPCSTTGSKVARTEKAYVSEGAGAAGPSAANTGQTATANDSVTDPILFANIHHFPYADAPNQIGWKLRG